MNITRQLLLCSMALLCFASCVADSRKGGKQPDENQQGQQPWPSSTPTPIPTPTPNDQDDDENQDDDEVEDKVIAVHAAFLRSEQGAIKVVMALLAASEQETLHEDTELRVLKARLTNFHVTPKEVEKLSEDGTEFSTALDVAAKVSVGEKFYCVEGKLEKTDIAVFAESLPDEVTAASLSSDFKGLEIKETTEAEECWQ